MKKGKKYLGIFIFISWIAFMAFVASVFLAGVSAALSYKGFYFIFVMMAFVLLVFNILLENRAVEE